MQHLCLEIDVTIGGRIGSVAATLLATKPNQEETMYDKLKD